MYVGLYTSCLPNVPLDDKMVWAAEQGFKGVELGCWPRLNKRDYSTSDIDVVNFTQEEADRLNERARELNLTITSLGYYDNNLSHDPEERAYINQHTKLVIKAAGMLGVPYVGTFTGRNIDKSIKDSFDEFEAVFSDFVACAEENNVKLMIENCPMTGWLLPNQPSNLSFSPELWHEMFRRIPSPNFGLNFDPSHLHWQKIDYVPLIEEFKDRIFHVHAKDMTVDEDKFACYGVYNSLLGEGHDGDGYWTAKLPGNGDVDFLGMIKALKAIGYDSVISIEHEDHEYFESEEKVKEGLMIGYNFLKGVLEEADAE